MTFWFTQRFLKLDNSHYHILYLYHKILDNIVFDATKNWKISWDKTYDTWLIMDFYKLNPRNPRTKIYPNIFREQVLISQYILEISRIQGLVNILSYIYSSRILENFVLKKYIIFPQSVWKCSSFSRKWNISK